MKCIELTCSMFCFNKKIIYYILKKLEQKKKKKEAHTCYLCCKQNVYY